MLSYFAIYQRDRWSLSTCRAIYLRNLYFRYPPGAAAPGNEPRPPE
jgi:hypothetical protein